jgi:hypothetical protein
MSRTTGAKRAADMTQALWCLPTKCEALILNNSSLAKNQNETKQTITKRPKTKPIK